MPDGRFDFAVMKKFRIDIGRMISAPTVVFQNIFIKQEKKLKNIYIKSFAIMAAAMTLMMILSYMSIGPVLQLMAVLIMAAGFVLCLKKVSTDGVTMKKIVFSLLSAVGAMAFAIIVSRLAVVGLFALAFSGGHHI